MLTENLTAGGLDIHTTAELLRRYAHVERGLMRMLAGWFLAAPAYETKYAFGYHLWDHAEHVDWIRQRLGELRGGLVRANAAPALAHAVEETVNASDTACFIGAAYLEMESALLDGYRQHLAAADPAANAAEIRLLQRMIPDAERHVAWARQQSVPEELPHRQLIRDLLAAAGGVSGWAVRAPSLAHAPSRFMRPARILFDERIQPGELTTYESREESDLRTSTIEDFKVFFNEWYAAALLASVLYDADPAELPWEFFRDFARQFWDEVRHSEFGAVRLKELGETPAVCNQTLFEQTQDLPVLHRVCYLTLGLEKYFMPRKAPRVKKFSEAGDHRSQLFADQDWSDEITHVRNGTKWVNYLLENDLRTEQDVLDEVCRHIEQPGVSAPF